MKKKLLCLALAGAMSMAAQAADKVKVGFVSTLSGPGGILGVAIRDGFQLGIEHTGGKLGGLPVELPAQTRRWKGVPAGASGREKSNRAFFR